MSGSLRNQENNVQHMIENTSLDAKLEDVVITHSGSIVYPARLVRSISNSLEGNLPRATSTDDSARKTNISFTAATNSMKLPLTTSWNDEGYGSWEEPSLMIVHASNDPFPGNSEITDTSHLPRTSHALELPPLQMKISPIISSDTFPILPNMQSVDTLHYSPQFSYLFDKSDCDAVKGKPSNTVLGMQPSFQQTIDKPYPDGTDGHFLSLVSTSYEKHHRLDTYHTIGSSDEPVITSTSLPSKPTRDAVQVQFTRSFAKFSHLLPELLVLVHKYIYALCGSPSTTQRTLYACSRVNKHWYMHSIACLWEHPYLPTESSIIRFAHSCIPPVLIKFNTDAPDSNNTPTTSCISNTSNGFLVRKLDFGRVRLHDPFHSFIFNTVAKYCTELRAVRLWCESLDIFTLQHIVTCSIHLDTLVVTGNLGRWIDVCDFNLKGFVDVVSKLSVLQVDVGFDGDFGRNRLVRLISSNVSSSIRHLRLAGADDDERIMAICNKCPNLQVLLCAWSNITEQCISHMATSIPDLRVLDLRGCQKAVTSAGMHQLLSHCHHLKGIDLSFTSGGDDVLASLIDCTDSMSTIILAGYACSEAMLVRLIKHMGTHLRVLSIAWFGGKFTDTAMAALAASSPFLEKLDIRGCRHISVTAIQFLVEKCKRLTILKLESSVSAVQNADLLAANHIVSSTTPISVSTSISGVISTRQNTLPIPTASRRRFGHRTQRLSAEEHERRSLLKLLRKRFPSDELVRLEETIM
ncbi:hypothetical protein QVD99_007014 [Batrachochytrium dendrobatidis]|nr:hypothetical protein O5D80_007715 [Batrachochytrium dendrobatidis]KAK5666250.1 hypothetical protein QVD99_007014 [Batrachochytrium dendrobatidis]